MKLIKASYKIDNAKLLNLRLDEVQNDFLKSKIVHEMAKHIIETDAAEFSETEPDLYTTQFDATLFVLTREEIRRISEYLSYLERHIRDGFLLDRIDSIKEILNPLKPSEAPADGHI